MKYSKFPCADHSNEPLKAEIVCASGLHDFLSFISIAQKETFHTSFFLIFSDIRYRLEVNQIITTIFVSELSY